MKPIIGITVDSRHEPLDLRSGGKLQLNWNYAQAVADAGGVPILIPPMAEVGEVARIIDGWLIPGGADMDASLWGEKNHPAVEPVDPARFESERKLYGAISDELPVLGICYGCQFINVLRGGSLHQHLPDVLGHNQHSGGTMQEYTIEPDTKLFSAVGSPKVAGKSYHHQAIRDCGSGLSVVAKDTDGLIEGIEATDRPWMVGVQWHPERTFEDAATKNLFIQFVEQAKSYAGSSR